MLYSVTMERTCRLHNSTKYGYYHDYGPLLNDKLTTTDYARQDNRMDKRLPTYTHTNSLSHTSSHARERAHRHTHITNAECICCTQSPSMETIHGCGWMGQSEGSNHGNVTDTQSAVKHSQVRAWEGNVTQHPYNISGIADKCKKKQYGLIWNAIKEGMVKNSSFNLNVFFYLWIKPNIQSPFIFTFWKYGSNR